MEIVDGLFETKMTVLPEWIDHNGHMNVAFYVLAFDLATDTVYEDWNLGFDYPERENCSIFTIGMNVDYLSELFEGDPIRVTTQLIDWDHKRVHYYHQMYHGENGRLAAANECLAMNVDLASRRSATFPDSVKTKLEGAWELQKELPQPKGFGRQLAIRRR
ncbi:MAG: thioesterase family protein [Chloroflexota bacterium]